MRYLLLLKQWRRRLAKEGTNAVTLKVVDVLINKELNRILKKGQKSLIFALCGTFLFSGVSMASTQYVYETIAYEASGEPFEAQVLVASVIQCRMLERGMSAEEVVRQKWQFSCNNPGARQKMKPRTAGELRTAKRAWDEALARNELAEETAAAAMKVNLYHDASVLPYWATARGVKKVIVVGDLHFYHESR